MIAAASRGSGAAALPNGCRIRPGLVNLGGNSNYRRTGRGIVNAYAGARRRPSLVLRGGGAIRGLRARPLCPPRATGGPSVLLIGCVAGGCSAGASAAGWRSVAQAEAKQLAEGTMDEETATILDDLMEFLGVMDPSKVDGEGGGGGNDDDSSGSNDDSDVIADGESESLGQIANGGGPGKPVRVILDPELIDDLPEIPLSIVQSPTGEFDGRLLVSHDGIVYDVTEFADHHPGGRDLLLTAKGLDLGHFFENYTVHGNSDKAAEWLAPMAVGKLSEEGAKLAREGTNSVAHVERRHRWLNKARRRIVFIAATLPMWMTVRSCVRFVGWLVPGLGRLLARLVPVTVPGFSVGAEPLRIEAAAEREEGGVLEVAKDAPAVAVIGGGIAGCGAAWALRRSGFRVTLFEAREQVSGNARTFDWDFSAQRPDAPRGEQTVKSCCSVTAWPPLFYKNYTCLLDELGVETVHQPLSWFLNSKVPGALGTLWAADPVPYDGSLRNVLKRDFDIYSRVVRISDVMCNLFTLRWAPWRRNDTPSMYDSHTGVGLLNPMNMVPLYRMFRMLGGSDLWWQVVFTPHYTASFLVDELRPFPAVFGPLIEAQIPLLPNETNAQSFKSSRSENDCNITTCQTWKDAGKGIREVFAKLTADVNLRENTRVREVEVLPDGRKRVHDEYDNAFDVDRVVFACPANAVGNIYKSAGWLANTIFSTLVYADDHHPDSGHMHAVLHSDGSVIDERFREDCLKRASNYVEVTELADGSINIENQYNFGVQTPGPGVYDLPLDQKPVMLISHALGEGKSIDPGLIVGLANHARAHPLYSGWNVMAMLSLRLVQGRDGIYYCSNWTTPGNCHDMSFLSGLACAHAVGAAYPFEGDREAKKDFHRLRDLMGI